MKLRLIVLLLLFTASLLAQGRLEFEVASIKPVSDQTPLQVSIGLHLDGAQVRGTWLSLRDYVGIAYRMKLPQIVCPEWMASARFDIAAKLPEGATQEQIPEMMQALLVDRFGLKLHHEMKELPVYALEVGKGGLKIKEAPADGESSAGGTPVNVNVTGSAAGVSVNLGNGSYYSFADNRFEAKKITMPRFSESLARFVDRPIVDVTGLAGRYDLSLDVSPEDYRVMLIRSAVSAGVVLPPQALRLLDEPSGDSLNAALEKAGLMLTPRKAPLDVVVVDSMQKMPTNN